MTYEDYVYYYYGLTIYIIWIIKYPWDGSTSWILTAIIIYKPFMWRRSDARLRHACYLFILYKPFMWRRSDARLRHVCHLFTIHKPFMWCRSDARLRHDLSYYPFEASLQTLDRCILFLLPYCIFIFYMNNLHACIMNFVYFVTDVMIIEYFGAWLSLVILYPCS